MGLYSFAKGLFRGFFSIMSWKVDGEDKVPEQGPVILVINHVSMWDPIVAACAVKRPVCFMAKQELFNNPLLGSVIRKLGAFPVKRGQGDMGAIRQSLAILKEGNVLGLFPEGTRSKTGELQKALPGMVLLSEKSGAPIVPIRVVGTRKLITQGWGKLRVVVGDPITTEQFEIPEGVDNRREWIAHEIMKQIDALT